MDKRSTRSNSSNLDDLKALINKENITLCKHIESLINKIKAELMDAIKDEVLKISTRLETLDGRLDKFEKEISDIKKVQANQRLEIDGIMQKLRINNQAPNIPFPL